MPRLKIQLPEKIIAAVTIPVRITDLNYGKHVGNSAMVEIIHEARVQFLKKAGFTELDIDGTSLILSELQVEFKNESFYNDSLNINIYPGEITRVAFELFYQISTVRNNDKEILIAIAKTGMVCYDYKIKKVTAIPEVLRTILASP